jgi:hypothetical protein
MRGHDTHPKTAAFILVESECRLSMASSTMKEFKRSVTYDREENEEERGMDRVGEGE